MPPLSHPTSCTPTTSNSYLANYIATVVSEPKLYRLLTSHVQILMYLFCYLERTKQPVQAQRHMHPFRNKAIFYDEEFLAPRPTTKLK